MSEQEQLVARIVVIGLYAGYIVTVVRSWKQAGRVDEQWDDSASKEWRWGKFQIAAGVIGIFIGTQTIISLPIIWRAGIVILSLIFGLCWGEWRMGTGFQRAADARDRWRARHTADDPYESSAGGRRQ